MTTFKRLSIELQPFLGLVSPGCDNVSQTLKEDLTFLVRRD